MCNCIGHVGVAKIFTVTRNDRLLTSNNKIKQTGSAFITLTTNCVESLVAITVNIIN